jgi:hypothetical protein
LVVGCAISAIVVAILLYVGLSFLGAQVASMQKGTVEFGTAGSGCQVSDRTSTFTPDQTVHVAAHLPRDVHAGETVTVTISKGGAELERSVTTIDSEAICLSGTVPASAFPGGHIEVSYTIGTELLAQGAFDITAP